MGSIEFESWSATLRSIEALNLGNEVRHHRLTFHQTGSHIHAKATGNVANYYGLIQELLEQMVTGEFQVEVKTSLGEVRKLVVSPRHVLENGKDISSLLLG